MTDHPSPVPSQHDAQCESELTSHGYTPCRCSERAIASVPPQDRIAEIRQRITEYLANGGLFNPELMQHERVRDLLIACRAEVDRLLAENARLKDIQAGVVDALDRGTYKCEPEQIVKSVNKMLDHKSEAMIAKQKAESALTELRAQLAQAEQDRDQAREEANRLAVALAEKERSLYE